MSKPDSIEPSIVQRFVGAAHGDLACVNDLLSQYPALANGCWDWGGGDFETALGAAAHMGRRDIAELLLFHGARMDVFAAAMLGHLDVVKAIVASNPQARMSAGPHGIPLIKHAEAGGEAARTVLQWLAG